MTGTTSGLYACIRKLYLIPKTTKVKYNLYSFDSSAPHASTLNLHTPKVGENKISTKNIRREYALLCPKVCVILSKSMCNVVCQPSVSFLLSAGEFFIKFRPTGGQIQGFPNKRKKRSQCFLQFRKLLISMPVKKGKCMRKDVIKSLITIKHVML